MDGVETTQTNVTTTQVENQGGPKIPGLGAPLNAPNNQGVQDAQIVSVNFEELEYEELLDYKKLYAYLKERLTEGEMTYIFLDEIQKVADFEKVVDSLYVKPDVDIYITGSNAYMLSGWMRTVALRNICNAAGCPMWPGWSARRKKWKPTWRVYTTPSL